MALTWRNVDAPDFTSSVNGFRSFSDLLGNAFGAAKSGLADFDHTIDREANNNLMLQLAGAKTAEDAQAIAASAATNPNARRFSGASLTALMARPTDLINQALISENLDMTKFKDNEYRTEVGAEKAAAPLLTAYNDASRKGEGPAFLLAHPEFAALNYGKQSDLIKTGQDSEQFGVKITGDKISNANAILTGQGQKINNESARFNLDTSKLNFTEGRQTAAALNDFIDRGGTADQIPYFVKQYGLSGPAELEFRKSAGGIGGSSGGAPGAGPIGDYSKSNFNDVKGNIIAKESGGDYNAIALGAKVPAPVTSMTMGELYDLQKGTIRPQNAGKRGASDIGSTGAGAYQFESETLKENAQKTFGDNWRNVKFSPENQDKVAATLFDRVKGNSTAAGNTWAALKNPPNPAQLAIGSALGKIGAATQASQLNAPSIAEALQPALADRTSSPLEVAQKLSSDGPLKGSTVEYVQSQITKIQDRAKEAGFANLSPAAAGVILQKSGRQLSTFLGMSKIPAFMNPRSIGGNFEIDTKVRDSYIDQLGKKDFQAVLATTAQNQQRDSQVEAAKTNYAAAQQAYAQATAQFRSNPRFDPNILARRQAAYEQAATALGLLANDQIVTSNGIGPARNPGALATDIISMAATGRPFDGSGSALLKR